MGHKPYIQLLCAFLFASLAFQVRDLPRQEESLGDEMSRQVIQTVNSRPPDMNISMLLSQVTQGIFAFFCTHAAGLAGKFQHLVLIMLVSEPQAGLPGGGVDPWVTPALEHGQLSLVESCAAASAHQQGCHPGRDPQSWGTLLRLPFGSLLRSQPPSLFPFGSGFWGDLERKQQRHWAWR